MASIRAAAEVGLALSETRKQRENYQGIIGKADQINALVTNLFSAALEDMGRLSVAVCDMASRELAEMLKNADYLHRAEIPELPECLICVDRLRLQQVYAQKEARYLQIIIEDQGGGVKEDELPLLKEKFRRGSNAADKEGAGLGLYISDFFMQEMQGELLLENGNQGLQATIKIPLSGQTLI